MILFFKFKTRNKKIKIVQELIIWLWHHQVLRNTPRHIKQVGKNYFGYVTTSQNYPWKIKVCLYYLVILNIWYWMLERHKRIQSRIIINLSNIPIRNCAIHKDLEIGKTLIVLFFLKSWRNNYLIFSYTISHKKF